MFPPSNVTSFPFSYCFPQGSLIGPRSLQVAKDKASRMMRPVPKIQKVENGSLRKLHLFRGKRGGIMERIPFTETLVFSSRKNDPVSKGMVFERTFHNLIMVIQSPLYNLVSRLQHQQLVHRKRQKTMK